jgi:hypothetical protein
VDFTVEVGSYVIVESELKHADRYVIRYRGVFNSSDEFVSSHETLEEALRALADLLED